MYRNIILGLFTLAAVLLCLCAAPANAQTGDSEIIYQTFGQGMHYFKAHDFPAAYEKFTQCIENESKNPSVYYFRGLTLINLGREDDAVLDFQDGANLEIRSTNDVQKQIGYDLQFVQGEIRLTLENYRTDAKLIAYQNARKIEAAHETINKSTIGGEVGFMTNDGYVGASDSGEIEEYEEEVATGDDDDDDDDTSEMSGDDDDDDDDVSIGDDDDDDDTTGDDDDDDDDTENTDASDDDDDAADELDLDSDVGDLDDSSDSDTNSLGDDDD
ncbi:MAG: hypothetical protein IJU53_06115, partial [Thermoguttaceae bacterium]|nr:hypothetical protein [Thermoguttaceae bacterium]